MACGSGAQVADDLSPIRVLALFSAVDGNDLELLDLACRPEHLLMSHLPVPPVCIRPSVEMDTGAGSNEDDITMKLMARPCEQPAVLCEACLACNARCTHQLQDI